MADMKVSKIFKFQLKFSVPVSVDKSKYPK